ncbi:Asp-tRNA(Asn)/Glu-tRNA(Gln) amidotransferase subunit GatC [Chondromyces crocatus]|uniref:Aspartyl/glutamyl-tRNA(Asn/Gln) amidotransferase subunit C n=1 Tax=Chondromyces crocatus TaxID=52 RepID=A0A0K1EKF6_CHOCO|nr:Asp-tRNA(Asn)/Glu-tRNA(Gln) amidotransferase subunit GatC [Chondromyces crocatus]AKT41058.1 glutamyl-tRNA amidotransferase subunit C [Chondromyces crocatus]
MKDAAPPPDQASPLQREQVLALARLAHLDLTDEEADSLTGDLERILVYIRQLESLDVSDVPPTANLEIEGARLREDEPSPSLPRDVALGQAPRVQEGGFEVPAFVDEG